MIKYPYLDDNQFLKDFDLQRYKEQFIRISVLDFKTEILIASIEGKTTSGSCNLNGSSNMRRTASCSLVVDPNGIEVQGKNDPQQYYNITEINNIISLNKKIRIDVGFLNTLTLEYPQYSKYKKIWFPLGFYVVKTANVSNSGGGLTLSLTLNDKCALLNGDMGGVIPAATVFSEEEIYSADGLSRKVNKVLIKEIIRQLVINLGGESPEKVIITDIPDTIVKVLKWTGKEDLYLYQENGSSLQYSTLLPSNGRYIKKFTFGEDIGYSNEPFTYPGTLECKAGETVSSVLDKIKNTLGNYEWFYDIEGRFIFQKVRDYVEESLSTEILNLNENDYFAVSNFSKSKYTFDNDTNILISSTSNAPQYQNIKNDFIVWGTASSSAGVKKPIRYHVSFAKKPDADINKKRLALLYTDHRKLEQALPLTEKNSKEIVWKQEYLNGSVTMIPNNMTNPNLYYYDTRSDKEREQYNAKSRIWAWDKNLNSFRTYNDKILCYIDTDDWRTELYLQGLESDDQTLAKNYYAAELNAEWPKIYHFKNSSQTIKYLNNQNILIDLPLYSGEYRQDIKSINYEYWLDFLEGDANISSTISSYNIDIIGRRSKIITDGATNCLFPTIVPDYVLLECNNENIEKQIEVANNKNQTWIQISTDIYSKTAPGGGKNSAFEKIKELLYTHTQYNEAINISTIPIYYLEPNTRISIFDKYSSINGDYLIKTISLPFDVNGTSTISATKIVEKTI